MRTLVFWIAAVLFAVASGGCALINVEMMPPVMPLQEKVLEGEGRPKLLVLDITGFISEKGKSGTQLTREAPSPVAQIKEALQKAEKDQELAGVIVRINSPGGTVTASDIIHHELVAFKERKKVPVYACITGLGTSGGYYLAAAADEISAHPTAVTGSIGVLLLRFNVEGLLGKIGVSEQAVKSGDKKDILSPFRPPTPEEQQLVQGIIDRLHGRFLEVILARPGNRLTRGELEKLADGRIFTADQALAVRLIDRVGYLDETIALLKKRQGLEEARVVSYYRPGSFKGSIYSGETGDSTPLARLFGISIDNPELLASGEFFYLWRQ